MLLRNLLSVLFVSFAYCSIAQVKLRSGDLSLVIDQYGSVQELVNLQTKQNYLSKDTTAPILSVISQNKRYYPNSFRYSKSTTSAKVSFKGINVVLALKILQKAEHCTFEITSATPEGEIDGIVWGPIPLSLSQKVGEIIGVVRDSAVAIGLQVLNVKTDGGDYSAEGATFARGRAALRQTWGSSIQAFSINRAKSRFADTWCGQLKNTPILPIPNETVVGSKIALFSCKAETTLDLIGKIEVEEGLPHPMIDGVWA